MAVLRSHFLRGDYLCGRPMASSALFRKDVARGHLRGQLQGGDAFHGRHVASSVVAGLRSSCPRGLVRNHMPTAVPPGYVHESDVSTVAIPRPHPSGGLPDSPSTPHGHGHGHGHGDIPWGRPAPPCPRRHDRDHPVASFTAVALSYPSPLPLRRTRTQRHPPSDYCLCGCVHLSRPMRRRPLPLFRGLVRSDSRAEMRTPLLRTPLLRTPPPKLHAPLAEVAHAILTVLYIHVLHVEYSMACTTPEF